MIEELRVDRVQQRLHTAVFGCKLLYFPYLHSTNTELLALAREGAPEGTVEVANYQTAGRGRLERKWWAPPGACLLFSVLFRPYLAAHKAQQLVMLCSLATAEAVERETGLQVQLKWPNDLLIGRRKLGGILTDLGLDGSWLAYVVVGIGLNVNFDLSPDIPPEVRDTATSLLRELGHPVERETLLAGLLNNIEARYRQWQEGRNPSQEWAARLIGLGKPVIITNGRERWAGIAEGVDEDGALLLRLPDGKQRRILAGDVSLRPEGYPTQNGI